jgi:hypothetical protein
MTIARDRRAVDKAAALRRAAGMDADWTEFGRCVQTVAERFLAQNGRPAAPAETARVARQLAALVAERWLPRPLAAGETGGPGGMPEAECASLAARVAAGTTEPLLAELARQLVKACFYPEFTVCRDSFRERARDGSCRRQELARVRGRVSGAHCVDCPHWVRSAPAEHAGWLGAQWLAGPAALAVDRGVYLPEDFRALRLWLHAAARA